MAQPELTADCQSKRCIMAFKVAPLSSGFMLISILGFIAFAFIFDQIPTWSFTMMVFFAIMFVASIISMTYAPIQDEHLDVLDVHNKIGRRKK
jgi:accessory gene regulator protein AgrB